MYKAIIGVSILAAGIGMAWFTNLSTPNATTYQAPEVQTVEKTIEVPTLEMRVKTEQEANRVAVEAKAKEAYDRTIKAENLEIERKVTAKYRAEIEAKEAELEKQASF